MVSSSFNRSADAAPRRLADAERYLAEAGFERDESSVPGALSFFKKDGNGGAAEHVRIFLHTLGAPRSMNGQMLFTGAEGAVLRLDAVNDYARAEELARIANPVWRFIRGLTM